MKTLIMMLLMAASATVKAGIILPPTTWRVGDDPACHFATIEEAIDASISGDSIRVSDGPTRFDVSISITNMDLDLSGGWEDCSATTRNYGSRTLLEGAFDVTPIRLSGNANQTVSVTGFAISSSGGFVSGGALRASGNLVVDLHDVAFANNGAVLGGAIAVLDGATMNISHASIGVNSAALGGGIYCQDSIVNMASAHIQYNNASSQGGGFYADNCFVLSPATDDAFPQMIRILGNEAGSGGGLYAGNGAVVNLGSDRNRELILSDNEADSGGAIYVEQAATIVNLTGAELTLNQALSTGSVAYVTGGGELDIDRGNSMSSSCFDPIFCSVIADNGTDSVHALVATLGGHIDIRQTFIERNHRLARVNAANSQLVLESVVIRDHQTDLGGVIEVIASASAQLRHVTTYNNDGSPALLLSDVPANHLSLEHSIFFEGEPILDGAATANCVSATDTTIAGAVDVSPGFVNRFDPLSTGLMLADDSLNVDTCAPTVAVPDILGRPRNVAFLSPLVASDRGAFEVQDILFTDGFN